MQQAVQSSQKAPIKMSPRRSTDLYGSIGRMVPSQFPSAPQYSMGKSQRKSQKKIFFSEQFAQIDMRGTSYTAAPNSYFPSSKVIEKNGKKIIIQQINKGSDLKYSRPLLTIIGKQPRASKVNHYMHYNNVDELNPGEADIRRRYTSSRPFIGGQNRFPRQAYDKITPSPLEYRPSIGNNFTSIPKYSFARRAQSELKLASRDEQTPRKKKILNIKMNTPGPGSYFTEKPVQGLSKYRSQSISLLRAPENSNMKSSSIHKFPLSQRSSVTLSRPGQMEQTYDIKTGTLMGNYDFQHDGGKGQHSGLGWLKERIVEHSKLPEDKLKMRSYSIGKSQRGQGSRGTFQAHMEFKPAPIRIQHPKF